MTPHLRTLGKRLDRIERSLVEAHQRVARTILHGKITQVRDAGGDWQVRLDMGDGVLSPWVPVQPASAGALKIKVKPTVGERMTMLSPSGTVGSGSWAVRGPFDEDHPAPQGDQDVILEVGPVKVTITQGRVLVALGAASVDVGTDETTVYHGEKLVLRTADGGEGIELTPSAFRTTKPIILSRIDPYKGTGS